MTPYHIKVNTLLMEDYIPELLQACEKNRSFSELKEIIHISDRKLEELLKDLEEYGLIKKRLTIKKWMKK